MLDDLRPSTVSAEESAVEVGPLMQLRVSLSRVLWRIGPSWSVLAGALAARAPLVTSDALLRLAAAVVLADLAWGMLRGLIFARAFVAKDDIRAVRPSAPYARAAAPLARFLGALRTGLGSDPAHARVAWQELLVGLAFIVALSVLLGVPALILSALAAGVTWLAGAISRRGGLPALCLALLDVFLPWLVGASLAWRGLAGLSLSQIWLVVALAAAFTVLQWGLHRMRAGGTWTGVWFGQATVVAALIGLRQPWALGVTTALFVPPCWWLARRAQAGETLAFSLPWWWAAMLLAGAVVR